MNKITVDKAKPAPGEYNTAQAWKSSQLGNREYNIGLEKKVNFTDTYKNNKKGVPGSGHYKYDVKHVMSKLS